MPVTALVGGSRSRRLALVDSRQAAPDRPHRWTRQDPSAARYLAWNAGQQRRSVLLGDGALAIKVSEQGAIAQLTAGRSGCWRDADDSGSR